MRSMPFRITWSLAAGRAGETAVGVLGQGKRIPSMTGTASYRVADQLTASTLTEVKNVKHLSLTSQIRDFNYCAESTGRQLVLYTGSNTSYSKPMQATIDAGKVVVRPIPGM